MSDLQDQKIDAPPNRRLTIEVSADVFTRIKFLESALGCGSMTEVIRRSTAVMEMIVKEKQAGGKFFVERLQFGDEEKYVELQLL